MDLRSNRSENFIKEQDAFFERFHKNERVIVFSDAVFAIVLTLLILELKTPISTVANKIDTNWKLWTALGHEIS